MAQDQQTELLAKLNDTCRRSLEGAAGLCLSRTNYNVEIEHWLLTLLENPNSDLAAILQHCEIDSLQLRSEMMKVVDRFKTGNARSPTLSHNVVDLLRQAWLLCSVDYGESKIRSGYILRALHRDPALSREAASLAAAFGLMSDKVLLRVLPTIIAETNEPVQPQETDVQNRVRRSTTRTA
jgi:type VI secretion system protein VasG